MCVCDICARVWIPYLNIMLRVSLESNFYIIKRIIYIGYINQEAYHIMYCRVSLTLDALRVISNLVYNDFIHDETR